MVIRPETEKDYKEVENLTREAFWNVYRPGCEEHYILHVLRNEPCFVKGLDYVIEDEGVIAAHIVYSTGTLTTDDGAELDMLQFGPISVLPAYQRQGLGSRLIRHTLELAEKQLWPGVLITGNPAFYGRFGFESASGWDIHLEGTKPDDTAPYFMIKVFDKAAMTDIRGVFSEPACFACTPEELERYDSAFPPKVKERRPGQLV